MNILIIKEGEHVLESIAQNTSIIIGINKDGSVNLLKDRFGDTEVLSNPKK